MTIQILTANRLRDGLVVFRAADGGWTERLAEALPAADPAQAAAMLLAAETEAAPAGSEQVVAPYLIDVEVASGTPCPTRYRELIRATGPSVPYRPSSEDQDVPLR